MLKCPGGHSRGDSAMICTARDFLYTARFMMNGGSWEGVVVADDIYARGFYQLIVKNLG